MDFHSGYGLNICWGFFFFFCLSSCHSECLFVQFSAVDFGLWADGRNEGGVSRMLPSMGLKGKETVTHDQSMRFSCQTLILSSSAPKLFFVFFSLSLSLSNSFGDPKRQPVYCISVGFFFLGWYLQILSSLYLCKVHLERNVSYAR